MTSFKSIASRVLATTLAFTFLPAAVPSGVPLAGVSAAQAQSFEDGRMWRRHDGDRFDGNRRYYRDRPQFRERPQYRERYYDNDRRYYGRERVYRRNNNGAAIAGAIIGLGVGAAIASANRPRTVYSGGGNRAWTRDWYNSCAARYRSFDPQSGTYQPNNGPRRMCR